MTAVPLPMNDVYVDGLSHIDDSNVCVLTLITASYTPLSNMVGLVTVNLACLSTCGTKKIVLEREFPFWNQ